MRPFPLASPSPSPTLLRFMACAFAFTLANAVAAPPAPAASLATLRIACDGPDANAEVTVNGEFKGECPVDVPVPAGKVLVRVVKKVGDTREAVFQQEYRVVAGTGKRVDVVLGEPELTPDGKRIEQQRAQYAIAEARRVADERRAKAEAADLAEQSSLRQASLEAIARLTPTVDDMLAAGRVGRASTVPGCPDCPAAIDAGNGLKLDTPTLADATLQAWLQQAKASASTYLATQGAEFVPPTQVTPLPCPSAQATVQQLTGFTGLVDMAPGDQKKFRDAMRALSANPVHQVRDVQVWPVQATCANGVLDGALDVWVFGTTVTRVDNHLSVTPRLVHYKAMLAGGKPTGTVVVESRQSQPLTQFSDPATDAMMKKNAAKASETVGYTYRDASEAGDARSMHLMLMRSTDSDVQKHMNKPHLSVSASKGPHRTETVTYDGPRLATRSFAKDGVAHGEMTIYGYSMPVGPFIADYKYPTTTTCFRDGKPVPLNPCVVD